MDATIAGRPVATIPASTYRLQFSANFRFNDALAIVPYLSTLGAGAIYASPYLRARPGSDHGYDVVDHNVLNPEVGTPEEHLALIRAAQSRGMGHILDFVPNHMGIGGTENPWWSDVLEWGERSAYAKYFDIDWHPQRADLEGKVLLPFLGDHYGTVLERGELIPVFEAKSGRFAIAYFETRYPLAPETYAPFLRRASELAESGSAQALLVLAESFSNLAQRDDGDLRDRVNGLRELIANLANADTSARNALERAIDEWRVRPEDPASIEALDELLRAQWYRLAFWRVSLHEINYRRFFDINSLAGLRVEDAEVFGQTHRFVFEMIADGRLQGLRIDHVDGLFDPAAYCRLLRDRAIMLGQPVYLIVEKILARFEQLRGDWGIDGTTGYDFLNVVNGLFVDSRAEFAFDRIYQSFATAGIRFDEIVYRSKQRIIFAQLASELSVLANQLYRIAHTDRRSGDLTYDGLREALAHVVAAFPVYRTYVTSEDIDEEDRRFIEWAILVARRRSDIPDDATFDFLQQVLTADITRLEGTHYDRTAVIRFAMRFQQYTSPVMAKGYEDTAFYRYLRLISLNEVGGDPRRFGTSVTAFHRYNENRAKHFPHAMLATATHDHKRGEDTRLRIDALSEMPGRWQRALRTFRRIMKKAYVDDEPVPSANDEYALYQTLLGTWPVEWLGRGVPDDGVEPYVERIEQWLRKALREGKIHSSWTNPNELYEAASIGFLHRVFDVGVSSAAFMREFAPLARDLAIVGMVSSLSQTVLKLTVPGVPDIYQGTELWDLSLVDPDNRRPVDFGLRERLLSEIRERFEGSNRPELARELLRSWHDGRIKLFVLWRLLQLRNERSETFFSGAYRRITTGGRHSDRLLAFARDDVLVIAPRLVYRILRVRESGIPELGFANEYVYLPSKSAKRYRNIFTGEMVDAIPGGRARLMVHDLLQDLPVAVLVPAE
jgi:(1->4)-alpha-D-glucan 1-alpha-D-glucosylmutase